MQTFYKDQINQLWGFHVNRFWHGERSKQELKSFMNQRTI